MQQLKKGYTTGVHASFVFQNALDSFLNTNLTSISKTEKMDNDDLDVTKGCEIIATISQNKNQLTLNKHPQTPQLFTCKTNTLELFAGVGVGVVTKKGLKIEPNFPAINPVPLESMRKIFEKLIYKKDGLKLYCSISITDGESIAKQSANAKVGVLGGLSVLGTTGIVKPVSNSAYLDSVKTEIEFIKQNGITPLVLTLGNSSLNFAKEHYKEEHIVEIGNFVYDAFNIAQGHETLFVSGIGKMTKVAQGFKNTHNKFGTIDFNKLYKEIKEGLHVEVEKSISVKGISNELEKLGRQDEFYGLIEKSALKQIGLWLDNSKIRLKILKV